MANVPKSRAVNNFLWCKNPTSTWHICIGALLMAFSFFMPAFAQSTQCAGLQVRAAQGTQVIVVGPLLTSCHFVIGGKTGVHTVYTHLTGQYTTPNSAQYNLTPNAQGEIKGCVQQGPLAATPWVIVQNSTACLPPTAKPTLNMIKLSSQNPFVVGKTGQSYTLNIYVSTTATSAPLLITDVLPLGIVTSGAITGPAGLAGCPSAGSTSLAGCMLPAGLVLGNYSITVPINVGGNAINGNNTASVTSLGAVCSNGNALPCANSVTVDILDAVDDVASGAAGSTGLINVVANDKYPAGQPNNQQQNIVPGGTCAGAQFTANGVISYVAPAAGTTCTVKYQFCHQGLCDTATLTVTGTAATASTAVVMGKVASHNPLVVGNSNQSYLIKIEVQSGSTSAPMRLTDVLPPGILTSGPITVVGGSISGCPGAGASTLAGCTIGAGVAAGTVIYITVPVNVASTATTGANSASITGGFVTCNNIPQNAAQISNCISSTGPVGITSSVATINVNVSGLPLGGTVALQNNGAGSINVIIDSTTKYTAAMASAYAVTAITQTPGVTCTVSNGSGNVTSNITTVTVSCTSRFTLLAQSTTSNHPATDCVKDTVTGLVWEGKPTSGTRMHTNTYTNYDSTTLLQYLNGSAYIAPTAAQIAASNNSLGYLAAVNGTPVCGFSGGWRIPTDTELFDLSNAIGLVSSPLAAYWLPNTNGSYLSSTAFSTTPTQQHFAMGKNFTNTAAPINYGRNIFYRIRLVR